MTDKVWPIGLYAPGGYACKCTKCGQHHIADKRASHCADCTLQDLRARVDELQSWRDVVMWTDADEKTLFDWCAGGGDPDGEFSRIGLRRELPDGRVLYRAYKATSDWTDYAISPAD